nr:PREDICTED: interleukin-1 receptor type 1-like [Latimeria chalumnae]|eukprot:XP_014346280.1 PREDICTED: interleukin-1 receptor type 1-like [Latimeria chalumnae]
MIALSFIFSSCFYLIAEADTAGDSSTKPEIIYPQNNTLEAPLGSNITMSCKASCGNGNGIIEVVAYWLVNETFTEEYSGIKVVEPSDDSCKKQGVIKMDLMIVVESEFYNTYFTCVVENGIGVDKGYILLKPSAPRSVCCVRVVILVICLTAVAIVTYRVFKACFVYFKRNNFKNRTYYGAFLTLSLKSHTEHFQEGCNLALEELRS